MRPLLLEAPAFVPAFLVLGPTIVADPGGVVPFRRMFSNR
jgi:hypothetical protein